MSPYSAVLKANFQVQLQYRAAAWAGIGTQLFFGFIKVMIFTGFFQSSVRRQPMDFSQVIDYLWLGQALLLILPFRIDRELTQLIRTGNLAYELSRPVDLYLFWYFRALAVRAGSVFLRVAPMIALTMFVFPRIGLENIALKPPGSLEVFLFFMLSLSSAFFLAAALSVLMSVTALWTISAEGVDQLLPSFVWIFSGIIIPLPFFPESLQLVFLFLPFRGMLDIPFRIYNGDLSGMAVFSSLMIQLFWIAALVLLGRIMVNRGLKRLIIQGG
ncbi:ABC transporter permease [Spirochaeta isovalerica]|uniref:ABC-2 type transport system permease protein n=1 Tax=Spirochaeta isovalerica TaxID=150 RepID=A0A841R9U8_9SPIO|nr:ABC-2 family transporter protein [Spirochaeta isovalerica]MBB6480536.1 ABC-2 type transport system permease protein [Spirochaeta isovalerica]